MMRGLRYIFHALSILLFAPHPVRAQATDEDIWRRPTLLGDIGGIRGAADRSGVQLTAIYIADAFANPVGGVRNGAIYEGRLELDLDADLESLFEWEGTVFHVNAYQIHGQGLTASHVGNLLAVSNLEARPATRLFDLWLQQELFDGAVSVRAGQLAADDEFAISQYAANFINATFGWPAFLGINLPSGGPAYPLATPGLRVKFAPTQNISLAAAIFNGNPSGPALSDPQSGDPGGTSFRLNDGAFVIAEAAYAFDQEKDAPGPPGTYRIGGWYHDGRFSDQRFDMNGIPLADSRSNGVPAMRQGDEGVYALFDQMIWRVPETADGGIGVFLRMAAEPSDRNIIGFNADTGVVFKGLLNGRDNDVIGLGLSYAQMGASAQAHDRDMRDLSAPGLPVRDFESVVEITYRAQIAPWWTVQPDVQYIIHPGGGAPDPNDVVSPRSIRNAVAVGVRNAVAF